MKAETQSNTPEALHGAGSAMPRRRYAWKGNVNSLLCDYECDGVANIDVQQSRESLSFRIDAIVAGEERRYFLRAINANRYSEREIQSELHWLQALRSEAGITVPEPVPRAGEDSLISTMVDADSATWHCVLFRWIPGTHVSSSSITLNQCEKLGELLARIHDHSESFVRPDWFERPEMGSAELIGSDEFCPPPDGGRAFSEEDFKKLNGVADVVRSTWSDLERDEENCRYGLTHADFVVDENILWNGKDFCPIDFTDCGWSFYLNDIATPLAFLAERRDFADIRGAFLSGYRRIRPLSSESDGLIDVFLAARGLFGIRQMLLGNWGNPMMYTRLAAMISHVLGAANRLLRARDVSPRAGQGRELGGHRAVTRLLGHLRKAGAKISLDGSRERLRITAPKGALSEELRTELSRRKAEIIAYLREAKHVSSESRLFKLPRPADGRLPLSFAQDRLFFLHRLSPGSAAYNMPSVFSVLGNLDIATFAASVDAIINRHETLRTRFASVDGQAFQMVDPGNATELSLVDLKAIPEARRETAGRKLISREAQRPFDLSMEHLLRVALVDLGGAEYILMVNMHHIISDGWSMGIFSRELMDHYGAFSLGQPSPLPVLEVQYGDFALWQRQWLSGKVLAKEIDYWRERLAGATLALPLPTDRPRPNVPTHRGASEKIYLTLELYRDVEALAHRSDSTFFMVMITAMYFLLFRYTGQSDLLLGTPIAGRTRSELEDLVGCFVNTLVLRANLAGDPTVVELLGRIRESTLGAYAHQEMPFEKLVEEIQPERNLSQSPLFQVLVSLDNTPARPWELPALTLHPLRLGKATAKFDLTLHLSGKKLSLEYDRDLFDAVTVRRALGHFVRSLKGFLSQPTERLSRLAILSDAERHQVSEEWGSGAVVAVEETLADLVSDGAVRAPDAPALICADRTLSYGELRRRSGGLARRLCLLGVGPEVRVGVRLERSPELVISILAVLEAGGAYVPIDPSYPAARQQFMARDSGIRILLSREPMAGVSVQTLDPDPGSAAESVPALPLRRAGSGNLAYVIYTSGSTGRPKGVAIEHRSAAALCRWAGEAFTAEEMAATLAATSISFDLSIFEIFVPLTHRGTVVLVENVLELRSLPSRVSLVNTVPSAAAELMATGGLGSGVCAVNLAGEALRQNLVDEVYDRAGVDRVLNLYGPSEDTTYSTWARIPRNGAVPSIGRPVAGARARVMGAEGVPVPAGVPGELLLGGVGLARCYFRRPLVTAERFVPDATQERGNAGARLYRTGDRARWRADGELEFLGRADHQVKIRGFRIEPGEVEAALCDHPQVEAALVLAREDAAGTRRLVAYVTSTRDGQISDFRTFLRERLPEHMVPGAVVTLQAFPLTANGKVDRRALPAPDRAPAAERPLAIPRTPSEELLTGIWAEVLGLDRVGIRDDFFALGGHSFLAARVLARIRDVFRVDLPLRELFATPTISELAPAIERLRRDGARVEIPPMELVPRDGRSFPLSFAQRRLWFLDQLQPGNPAYNISAARQLPGNLDRRALERALADLIRRHESLRTRFELEGDEPVQAVVRQLELALPQVDVSALESGARGRALRLLAAAQADQAFDLRRAPLLRCVLVRLDDGEHVFLLTLHHIVADGWSLELLFYDLSALYGAHAGGRFPPGLPELPFQYIDFATWQNRRLTGELLRARLDHWRHRLGSTHPVLRLSADRPATVFDDDRGAVVKSFLPPESYERLQEVARRRSMTRFMILVAALKLLLHRYTNQPVISVGTPIAGRPSAETESIVGLFLNVLVLRTDLSGAPRFEDLLLRARETILDAYEHQDLPFEKLVEELSPRRELGVSPLFQVMLNDLDFRSPSSREADTPDSQSRPVDVAPTRAKLDLTLHVTRREGGAGLSWVYRAGLFDRPRIARMSAHFENLLRACLNRPGDAISDLPLSTDAEAHQVLVEWNDTAVAEPENPLLHGLFEAQARRTPDAVAVVFANSSLTYRGLDVRSGALASGLRRRGVGRATVVGIYGEPSTERVVMALAALRAGAACLPLDSSHPVQRLLSMVEDVGAAPLLSQEPLPFQLAAHDHVLVARIDGGDDERISPATEMSADHAALVLYTSGSTGEPKGVILPHRLVCSRLLFMRSVYGIEASDRVLHKASFGFDVAWWEILLPLVCGGQVIIAGRGRQWDTSYLVRTINDYRVTVLHFVPSALKVFLETSKPMARSTLRLVLSGGEMLPVAVKERFFKLVDGRLYNQYGMTETSIDVSFHACAPGTDPDDVSVGRPYGNTRLYVLDTRRNGAPIGISGELCVGGPSSAWGYRGRPVLTARSFFPDPFAPAPGGRLYGSGDLARRHADGRLAIQGRLDQQVKVRGVRIEPAEVAAVLEEHPGVREAAVIPLRHEDGAVDRLAVYLVGGKRPKPSNRELRAWLEPRLPEPMVPSVVLWLEALPHSASGKVDRAALPAVEIGRRVSEETLPARNLVELRLLQIWEEVLDVRPIGVTDDFFDLGGHSLMAVRLMARVREQLGRGLPLATLFQRTVEQLAELLNEAAAPSWSPLVELRPGGAKEAFFCVHPAGGGVLGYAALARGLDGDRPFVGLQARGLDGADEPLTRIEEMAASFLDAVRETQPEGPFFLGGWSLGGIVAFEMARRLQLQGAQVAFLALMDVYAEALPNPADEDDAALLVAVLGEWLPLEVETLRGLTPDEQLAHVLQRAQEAGRLPAGYGLSEARRLLSLYKVNMAARRAFAPLPYSGRIDLFRAEQQPPGASSDPTMGWGAVADRVEVHPVPGNHQSMIREPDVQGLITKLRRCLRSARLNDTHLV